MDSLNKLMKKNLLRIIIIFSLLFPASTFSQQLFLEQFSTGTLPAGWLNDSLGLPVIHGWDFDNPYSRQISGAGFNSDFAIFDSDQGNVNDNEDENATLTSPSIDISAATVSLYLEFDQQYQEVTGTAGSTRILQYKISGGSWITIDSSQTSIGFPNPAVHSVYDISAALPATSLKVRFRYIGSWDWWWAIDNVSIISRQTCTGQPVAGVTQSNNNPVCAEDTFHLYLTSADQNVDLKYQWQSSANNVNWTNMLDDTNSTADVSQVSDTYYRCKVMCNSQSSNSIPLFLPLNQNINSCYCIPIFTNNCDILNKVVFNTLSNINSGCNNNPNNYINYPDSGNFTTTVHTDSTYDLTIASDTGSGPHGAGVWFDFDHNGNFNGANEFFHIADSIQEFSDTSVSITIPSSAYGNTRMRIRYIYERNVVAGDVCESFGFGETEDYTINIFNPSNFTFENIAEQITVYPSPATGIINISTGHLHGNFSITLIDLAGRLCMEKEFTGGIGMMNVENLDCGLFILRITSEKGVITRKIILTK